MNLFTDHAFGRFADDGFGNLVRLTTAQALRALYTLSQDELSDYYTVGGLL